MSTQNIESLIEELIDAARQVGLYAQTVMPYISDPEKNTKLHEQGEAFFWEAAKEGEALLVANFILGDQAWSDRVQHPEKYEIDKAAQDMLPTEAERVAEELRRRLEEGKGIFGE